MELLTAIATALTIETGVLANFHEAADAASERSKREKRKISCKVDYEKVSSDLEPFVSTADACISNFYDEINGNLFTSDDRKHFLKKYYDAHPDSRMYKQETDLILNGFLDDLEAQLREKLSDGERITYKKVIEILKANQEIARNNRVILKNTQGTEIRTREIYKISRDVQESLKEIKEHLQEHEHDYNSLKEALLSHDADKGEQTRPRPGRNAGSGVKKERMEKGEPSQNEKGSGLPASQVLSEEQMEGIKDMPEYEAQNHPRVFISYSWKSEDYKERVLKLAIKLRGDGVDVILDRWNLKPGQDMYYFMENSIRISDRVLVLCEESYTKKADGREGGVGTETIITAPEVYRNPNQEKFIPVIMEHPVSLPTYLKGRLAVDNSNDDGYEKILSVAYGAPVDDAAVMPPVSGQIPEPIRKRLSVR